MVGYSQSAAAPLVGHEGRGRAEEIELDAYRSERVERLFMLVAEAAITLNNVLEEMARANAAEPAQPDVLAPWPPSEPPPVLLERREELDPGMTVVAAFAKENVRWGTGISTSWEELARRRIRERFTSLGNVGAGVFLRLLATPGMFVSRNELAIAAGVKSESGGVIKVYICRLREALADHGLSSDFIETGRRSYRLQEEAVPGILRLLTHA